MSDERLLPRRWFRRERRGGNEENLREMGDLRNPGAGMREIPQRPDDEPPVPINEGDNPRRTWYDRISPQTRSILLVWILGFFSLLTFRTDSADVTLALLSKLISVL